MQADQKESEFMPKVDHKKLKPLEILLLKRAEEINYKRAIKYQKTRKNTSILALGLTLGVIGIYSYTIYAVKQETFLDDFNEPETVVDIKNVS
ncbi:cytochrome c oxidase assembly factor 3, mitochondrial-like [Colletes latitarsis]|uniref:cytochrome c oxidase assembly factor 3, mitochondrial-like n=1 Tax=Colletes latitarsis TaxID=2605962 RepID=UPI0040357592